MNENFSALPAGRAPLPVPAPHFPDALHAVVWRNWDVIDVAALSEVLQGTPEQITEIASSMGLPAQREILPDELRRNYMTVIRRNWHLLPYEQICRLLHWTPAEMQFALNEDDFMWVKLGGYKPQCPPVYYQAPNASTQAAVKELAGVVQSDLSEALNAPSEPLFEFIKRFNHDAVGAEKPGEDGFQISMVYPYFLRYGDPLRGEGVDDIPEGYLAELAASGVTAIWLQAVLNTLYPWSYAPELSVGWEERIANLNRLVERCRKFGIEVLLYLNEPRAMHPSFFEKYPELLGVSETPAAAPTMPNVQALCTSTPVVQEFLVNSVQHVFESVPGLGGVMVITFSENLTNCYSREYSSNPTSLFPLRSDVNDPLEVDPGVPLPCPRCVERGPEVINAEVCTLIDRGMRQAGSDGKFLLYYWSTPESWVEGIIERLPKTVWLQCVSEWGKTFTRGDYTGTINEYSISEVGPSEQSLRQWDMAKKHGLKTVAKMQAVNTYEFSSIPYIPALRLVAEHLQNITNTGVDGVTLGWTAGGSPSPNLELVAEFAHSPRPGVQEAMLSVAARRFGEAAAPAVVQAWDVMSDAYAEFPFDISVCYNGPQSLGPANLLYAEPTGFPATMSTFPFDDLAGWRGPYSETTFQSQFEKVAEIWQGGVDILNDLRQTHPSPILEDEWRVAEAALIHYKSTANQAHFVRVRQSDPETAKAILLEEIELAKQLIGLVAEDSRIGFEATNQYGYMRYDLAEKILNCRNVLAQMA